MEFPQQCYAYYPYSTGQVYGLSMESMSRVKAKSFMTAHRKLLVHGLNGFGSAICPSIVKNCLMQEFLSF